MAYLCAIEHNFIAKDTALHEDRGTMTCRLDSAKIELETPLVHAEPGSALRIGIHAGDLLLATEVPRGLSARNVLPGTIRGLDRRDVIIAATVDCSGAKFQ